MPKFDVELKRLDPRSYSCVESHLWPVTADTKEQVEEFFKRAIQPKGMPLQKGASFMVTSIKERTA